MTVASDRISRAFNMSGTKCSTSTAGLLHKLKSYGISSEVFGIVFSFLSNGWLWMGILFKNIQLMQKFLKALILVIHFSFYTSMIFLMMLSAILLSMLMILLSMLNVIRDLICGKN